MLTRNLIFIILGVYYVEGRIIMSGMRRVAMVREASALTFQIGRIVKKRGVEKTFSDMIDDQKFPGFVSELYSQLPDESKIAVSEEKFMIIMKDQRDKKLKTKKAKNKILALTK